MRKRLFTLIGALVAITLPLTAFAQTWNIATAYPDFSFQTKNVRLFAEDVEKATKGKIVIVVHSGQSLIKHTEIKNAVRSGQVQMGELAIGTLGNESPIFEIDMVPFAASNYEEGRKLWDAQRPFVEKIFAKQGIRVLYAVAWSPQGLFVKRQIENLDDLKALRFRAYSKMMERFALLSRMVPTQTEATEIATAFMTGRVDAMMTSPKTGANNKAWDWCSHYYHVGGMVPKNIVIIREKLFQSLDEKTKDILLECARKAQERGWEMSKNDTSTGLQELKEHGMMKHPASEDLKNGMREIGKTLLKEWLDKAGDSGKELIDAYDKSLSH